MSNQTVYQVAFQIGARMNSSLRTAFANTNRSLSDLRRNSSGANAETGLLSKGFGAVKLAALGMGAAIGTAAASLAGFTAKADAYNSSLKQIQASTGASAEEMKEIQDISKNLYTQNLGEDWDDLADAISKTKSVTQLSGKELEQATANALIYRDVFGEDITQSIKASDTMVKNFGISSEEAFNLLAQGAQKGLNKSDELLDSANEYGPYFAKLGFSANQMFDTFSAGLSSGAFNLDKVGDAVKEFNIRAKDGSNTTIQAFQDLGMNANEMMQTFANGGPEAQQAFRNVVQAISAIENPVKKNEIGVALLGTQFEDLESDVIAAMGTAKSQFDMTKQTMEQIQNIKYDTLGNALKGIGRQIEANIFIPLGQKALPIATKFSKRIASLFTGLTQLGEGDRNGFIETMTKAFGQEKGLGIAKFVLSIETGINKAKGYFSLFKSEVSSLFDSISSKIDFKSISASFSNFFSVIKTVGSGIYQTLGNVFTIIRPVLGDVIDFVIASFRQVGAFWTENGPMIIQAIKNVFSVINSVLKVLAPVILFIIQTVWGNIKGVIQGAMKVIMGVIKIFAGLFTGDFGKMWEGVKQLFVGAVQFLWNFINLLFVGKILGGIKALATGAIKSVSGMWTSIKTFFSGGATNVWNNIVGLIPKLKSGFVSMKNTAVQFAKDMWTKVSSYFSNIVSGARSLPGKIGAGIKNMAHKALSGVVSMGNTLLKGIGKIVNGVIKGLNWVLGKVGVDTAINEWKVPQYARGTNAHPGGLAILGDGGGPELFRTPQGQVGLSPGTDTLMNLPKGTQVIPAKQTQTILSTIPAYAKGTGVLNAVNEGASWLKDKTASTVSAVKETALDVFSYISNPSKLFDKVLKMFGFELPSMSGTFSGIISSSFSLIKEKSIDFIKDKLNSLGSVGNFSGKVADNAQVRSWIIQALKITNTPLSWLPAMMIKAQKESGYNPRAINLWDSNAKKGIPSKGLFQTIDPTFNAYKIKGMDDIWNPVHNAVAAIRYIKARYGTVFNTPGMRSMAKGGAYKGYYKGGTVPNTQFAWVGERGPELLQLPGGTRVTSNEKSNTLLSKILSFGTQTDKQSVQSREEINEIKFVYSPQVNISGGTLDEASLMELAHQLKLSYEEFKQFIERYFREQKRLKLN